VEDAHGGRLCSGPAGPSGGRVHSRTRQAVPTLTRDHSQGPGGPTTQAVHTRQAAHRSRLRCRSVVDDILTGDRTAPAKQRHTATQIFRRLVAEHNYTGSYHPVQRYLQQRRLDRKETFLPLDHTAGQRLEAFTFFGCVPRELWWDNPKTVAIHLFKGRERTLHPRYAALASHYTFTPRFCMPRTPTEKPRVEKRVQDLERQWATPVPRVRDFVELNTHLHRQCLAARERTCGDSALSVGARFEQDRVAALSVPTHRFDPCVIQPAQVDKYQTARFDRNSYSVPRRWAFRTVSVKGYIDRVEVVGDGAVVATHLRSYASGQKILDPLHFLGVLERKPATLDHASVYRDWPLPAVFATLRAALINHLGSGVGTRHYIRVLQLLANHPAERLEPVLAGCLSRGELDATIVTAAARLLPCDNAPSPSDNVLSLGLAAVTVRPPDLAQFDRLLSRSPTEGDADVHRDDPVVTHEQPEATEVADDAPRVGEVEP
jgi:hypothetical protein